MIEWGIDHEELASCVPVRLKEHAVVLCAFTPGAVLVRRRQIPRQGRKSGLGWMWSEWERADPRAEVLGMYEVSPGEWFGGSSRI